MGQVDPDELRMAITPRTILVSATIGLPADYIGFFDQVEARE
jgi:hypothetical protein